MIPIEKEILSKTIPFNTFFGGLFGDIKNQNLGYIKLNINVTKTLVWSI